MSTIPAHTPVANSSAKKPAWQIVELFPAQGDWSEEEYFLLGGNRLVELSDASVEVLPMPTQLHQIIVFFLAKALELFTRQRVPGTMLTAPFSIRLWPGKIREPDIMFMLAANDHKRKNEYWDGADLVIEVMSPDDPNRDLVTKRDEYARAGIAEYWIVDPRVSQITVLKLAGESYQTHGVFAAGHSATSHLLAGFSVDVTAVFAAR